MNLNSVSLIGRITKDLQPKSMPNGNSVVSFGLATNRTWKGKDGKKNEETEFHNIVCYGKTAELICQYMTKGCEVMIQGRLKTRSWDDKTDGKKRYMTEIIADSVQFGARPKGSVRPEQGEQQISEEFPVEPIELGEDVKPEDLPF